MLSVIHRIGGLEINYLETHDLKIVIHRIGGLESILIFAVY